jgi:hypothetical protein
VVGAGIKLNAPMIGQGDYFQAQVNYTEGALRYIFMTPNSNWGKIDGNTIGYGVLSDAVHGGSIGNGDATSLELTTGWGVNAAYEHFWNPRWRTSVYGGYAAVSYGTLANAMLCSNQGNGTSFGAFAVAGAGCNNDWSTWWVGSRTQWNVTKDFYMGVDVLYSKLQSAEIGTASGGIPAGFPNFFGGNHVTDQDNWGFRFRVHRDFYP